jgi:hypothetical protein
LLLFAMEWKFPMTVVGYAVGLVGSVVAATDYGRSSLHLPPAPSLCIGSSVLLAGTECPSQHAAVPRPADSEWRIVSAGRTACNFHTSGPV